MKFETIENIIVWQKARTLAVETYTALESTIDNDLKEMLRKSTITIMNTIAEGYEKPSKQELIGNLYAAKVWCGTCRSMLHLSLMLGTLNNMNHQKLIDASLDVTKLLAGFIKKLKEVKPGNEATPA